MTESVDAVVIGGGVLGASVAHFLVREGFGKVVLLEKGEICSGATGYSAGHVRAHYSNEVGIRLAMRGHELISNAAEWFGAPAGFVVCPYMVLADSAAAEGLSSVIELQRGFGVDTAVYGVDEIAARFPYLQLDGVALCSLEHSAGYADPRRTVEVIVEASRRLGLDVRDHTEVTGIKRGANGAVEGVVTSTGEINTPVVVNAAGPWGARIGKMVGIDYNLTLSREHEGAFEVPVAYDDCPIVSDPLNSIFFRNHGSGELLLGAGYPKDIEPCDPDTYDDGADDAELERLTAKLLTRVPDLRGLLGDGGFKRALKTGWSGVYSITEDWYPIVGAEPGVEGYYAAIGGSGHAFKLSPAIGESLAAAIAGREPGVDISALRPGRFAEGDTFSSVWGPGNRG